MYNILRPLTSGGPWTKGQNTNGLIQLRPLLGCYVVAGKIKHVFSGKDFFILPARVATQRVEVFNLWKEEYYKNLILY